VVNCGGSAFLLASWFRKYEGNFVQILTGVVPYGDEYVISDYSMHEYYPEIRCPGDWNTPNDIYVSRIRFGSRGSPIGRHSLLGCVA